MPGFRLVFFLGQCKRSHSTYKGRNTILTFLSNLLAEHQDIQARLRQDCLQLQSYKHGDLPTPAEIKGLRFLSNVLHEGMVHRSNASNEPFRLI